jgi:hypothetical protein
VIAADRIGAHPPSWDVNRIMQDRPAMTERERPGCAAHGRTRADGGDEQMFGAE